MHLPDAWGYVEFTGKEGATNTHVGEVPLEELMKRAGDVFWPARLAAMNVYYAQNQYKEDYGTYAKELVALAELINQNILSPFDVELNVGKKAKEYTCTVRDDMNGFVVTVNQERLLEVKGVYPQLSRNNKYYDSDWTRTE